MIVSFLWVYDDDETQVVVVVCGVIIEREVRFIDWNKLNRIFMCLIFEHFYYFFNNQFLKEKFPISLTDLQSRLNSSFYNFQHQTKIDFFSFHF